MKHKNLDNEIRIYIVPAQVRARQIFTLYVFQLKGICFQIHRFEVGIFQYDLRLFEL